MNLYTDHNAHAAAWLDALQSADEIPRGHVVCDDIAKLSGRDLGGYAGVHFFAGIGGWPHALRLAGWPDGAPVWTGSCPCQPFSQAGKQQGTADERHLWPEFARLIGECRPPVVFGEQVASALGREWLARVRLDLEAMGYAVGAADLCAPGVGAPHIRQRLFFGAVRLADADNGASLQGRPNERRGATGSTAEPRAGFASGREPGGLADADGSGLAGPSRVRSDASPRLAPAQRDDFWSTGAWLDGKDGKSRRVKPGVCLLADGLPGSVADALSGYGNAIVPQLAAQFVRAFCEATECLTG